MTAARLRPTAIEKPPRASRRVVLAEPAPAIEPKPFVKWVGGKRQLLPELVRYAPKTYRTYYEPFVGGGALFFHLRPERAVLADQNARLVRTYKGVRDSVDLVVERLQRCAHTKEFFLQKRQENVDAAESDADVAAWFIYLNKTGYNGLYRVNRQNRFNVPFGNYKRPRICDERTLRACAEALRRAEIREADFEAAVKGAKKGDFVYFDPPYVPLSSTSSFTSYTQQGFDHAAQVRLRDLALRLKRRGVHVLLSNSSAPQVRALYAQGFEVIEVQASRMVNSKAHGRGRVTELLIR